MGGWAGSCSSMVGSGGGMVADGWGVCGGASGGAETGLCVALVSVRDGAAAGAGSVQTGRGRVAAVRRET